MMSRESAAFGAAAVLGLMSVLLELALQLVAITDAISSVDAGSLKTAAFLTTLACAITAMRELYYKNAPVKFHNAVVGAYLLDMVVALTFGVGAAVNAQFVSCGLLTNIALLISGLLLFPYLWFCVSDFWATFPATIFSAANGDTQSTAIYQEIANMSAEDLIASVLGNTTKHGGKR